MRFDPTNDIQILSNNFVGEFNFPYSLNDLNQDIASYFERRPFKTQAWLGGLQQQIYGGVTCPYRSLGRMPPGPLCEAKNLIVEKFWKTENLKPNVAYVQRTSNGVSVKEHRDPATDKEFTTILYLGDFVGRTLHTREQGINLAPGMLIRLRCTTKTEVGEMRGPLHWASSHRGTCYTLIFNCSQR